MSLSNDEPPLSEDEPRAAAESAPSPWAAASQMTHVGERLPRRHRAPMPEDVMFPVTPMLDMAFQLLAFFVLTFQAPTGETHIDLDLPTTPAALPGAPQGQPQPGPSRKADSDLENDLWVRAEADDLGDLKTLRLGEVVLPDVEALGDRLKKYVAVLESRPLRVRLIADDRLRYEEAARVMAVCNASGVSSIRLANPSGGPAGGGAP